jgi:hypothetical protein
MWMKAFAFAINVCGPCSNQARNYYDLWCLIKRGVAGAATPH